MKKAIATGIILSMLVTPCFAAEKTNQTLWNRVPTKAKIITVAVGSVVTYGVISNPKILQNVIMSGFKSQKSYTAQQHRAWVKLVKTGKPTITKKPKIRIPKDNRPYQEKLGDLLK